MCRDREHLTTFLNQHLRKVNGVLRTQTFTILHTYKMAFGTRPRLPLPDQFKRLPATEAKNAEG